MIRTLWTMTAAAALALCAQAMAQPSFPVEDQPYECPTRLRVDDTTPTVEFLDPAKRGIRTHISPQIAGVATGIERWPGFVSLRFVAPPGKKFDDGEKTADFLYWCGGVLIARNWVMTAAHCLYDGDSAEPGPLAAYDAAANAWTATARMETYGLPAGSKLEIVEQSGDLTKIETAPLRPAREANAAIVHPDYFKPRRYANDIALIRLDPATPARGYLAKISANLAVDPDPVKGRAMLSAGFGLTDLADPTKRSTASSDRIATVDARYAAFQGLDGKTGYAGTPYLQESLVRKLDDSACKAHILGEAPGDGSWRNAQICAQGVAIAPGPLSRNVPDSCNTDSGGPLMQLDAKGCPIVSGIVSFGPTICGRRDRPGVYTRVSAYVPWIRQTTGNAAILAVADPAAIPPAGAVYSLLAGQTDLPDNPDLMIRRSPDGPERIGDVRQVEIAASPVPRLLTVLQRDASGRLAYLLPRKVFDFDTPDGGPVMIAANSATVLPRDPDKGFLIEGPPGPRTIFAFAYDGPGLHEALKLEMRSRPRRLAATPAIRDEILRRLKAWRGLSLAQIRYEVTGP